MNQYSLELTNSNIFFAGWLKRIFIFLALLALICSPLLLIAGFLDRHAWSNSFLSIDFTGTLAVFIAAIISSAFIERMRYGGRWFSFGISLNRSFGRDFGVGFLFALASMFVFIIFAICFGKFPTLNPSMSEDFVRTVLFIFFAAAVEEFIFRGVMFQALLQRFGFGLTVFVSSFLFALGHTANPGFSYIAALNTLLAGIVLGCMYYQTKSLWLPISFHFFWNWLQLILVNSFVSGNILGKPVLNIDILALPGWLFGGYYGIEGGLISTVLLIVLIFLTGKISYAEANFSAFIYKRNYLENQVKSVKQYYSSVNSQ